MKIDELLGLVDSAHKIQIDAVSELTLTHLRNIAEKELENRPLEEGNQDVTAVITTRDNIYTGPTGDALWGAELIQKLAAQGDTQVTHLVTCIRSYTKTTGLRQGVDVPSYRFREMLLELNEKNAFALLVLQGYECLRARTVGSTMPKKKNAE